MSIEDIPRLSILTFDNKIIIWSILNDVKDLKIINGLMTPKTNEQIENDLIESFYLLGLDSDNLQIFLKIKIIVGDFLTETQQIFFARYQANKVNLFSNLKIIKIMR